MVCIAFTYSFKVCCMSWTIMQSLICGAPVWWGRWKYVPYYKGISPGVTPFGPPLYDRLKLTMSNPCQLCLPQQRANKKRYTWRKGVSYEKVWRLKIISQKNDVCSAVGSDNAGGVSINFICWHLLLHASLLFHYPFFWLRIPHTVRPLSGGGGCLRHTILRKFGAEILD